MCDCPGSVGQVLVGAAQPYLGVRQTQRIDIHHRPDSRSLFGRQAADVVFRAHESLLFIRKAEEDEGEPVWLRVQTLEQAWEQTSTGPVINHPVTPRYFVVVRAHDYSRIRRAFQSADDVGCA